VVLGLGVEDFCSSSDYAMSWAIKGGEVEDVDVVEVASA
jgi:hypothetical protein